MSALNRAFTLMEMDKISVLIAKDLKFDMTRALNETFQ